MDRVEHAVAMFNEGFVCSQAILATYGDRYGLDKALALTLASGFGGGIGRSAGICGAVSGAVMVLGLARGYTSVRDNHAKQEIYKAVQAFFQEFQKRHGTVECKELLGYDIGSGKGYQAARDSKAFQILCPVFVQSAATILEGLLEPPQATD